MKKTIFIHIPKTGGTSINAAMQDSNWQTEPNFYYRHLKLNDKKSNAGDIFLTKNLEKYRAYNLFMMLRHPVDRCISEYYFIKERKNFMDLLQKKPSSFERYIKNKQTQNGVVNFLRGKRFYPINPAQENDLDLILNAIDDLPIHVGIFEHFGQSLDYFTQLSQIELKQKIEVKRMTFKRPAVQDLSDDLKELILDKNQLDWELYQYCLKKFERIQNQYSAAAFSFEKDKYNHVIPYAAQCCFFEFSVQNKAYLQQNLVFFRDLTFYLLKDLHIQSGLEFTYIWNESYKNAIHHQFPNSSLNRQLQQLPRNEQDPLAQSFEIAAYIDAFLEPNRSKSSTAMNSLQFDANLVAARLTNKSNKKGFFNKLFGRK
jgi:hypothetical protein